MLEKRKIQTIPSLRGREAAVAIQIGRASCRESDWSSDVCSSDLAFIQMIGIKNNRSVEFLERAAHFITVIVGGELNGAVRRIDFPGISRRSECWKSEKYKPYRHCEAAKRPWQSRSEERRVGKVTGVQTCALPILLLSR